MKKGLSALACTLTLAAMSQHARATQWDVTIVNQTPGLVLPGWSASIGDNKAANQSQEGGKPIPPETHVSLTLDFSPSSSTASSVADASLFVIRYSARGTLSLSDGSNRPFTCQGRLTALGAQKTKEIFASRALYFNLSMSRGKLVCVNGGGGTSTSLIPHGQ